jgi:hypothetical protein
MKFDMYIMTPERLQQLVEANRPCEDIISLLPGVLSYSIIFHLYVIAALIIQAAKHRSGGGANRQVIMRGK